MVGLIYLIDFVVDNLLWFGVDGMGPGAFFKFRFNRRDLAIYLIPYIWFISHLFFARRQASTK